MSSAQIDLTKDASGPSGAADVDFSNFDSRAPHVGDPMPDFSLPTLSGSTISLSQFRGQSAVLVMTGAASCDVTRRIALPALQTLEQQLPSFSAQSGKSLQILFVNVIEPHPALDPSPYTDGQQWTTHENVDDQILLRMPVDLRERQEVSQAFATRFGLDPTHVLLDGMDNAVWTQLGSVPNALYLIDINGNVAFKEVWAFETTSGPAQTPVAYGQVRQLLQP